jgi:hypothetical protein
MTARTDKVGTFINQQYIAGFAMMSSDTTIVGPDARGNVYAKAPGVAYLITMQIFQDGHPVVKGWRVTVTP